MFNLDQFKKFYFEKGISLNKDLIPLGQLSLKLGKFKIVSKTPNINSCFNKRLIIVQKAHYVAEIIIQDKKLDKIPEEIFKFERLEAVYLDNNNITEFPISILKLSQIKIISLTHNPITTISNENQQFILEKRSKCKVFLKETPYLCNYYYNNPDYHLRSLERYTDWKVSNIIDKVRGNQGVSILDVHHPDFQSSYNFILNSLQNINNKAKRDLIKFMNVYLILINEKEGQNIIM